MHVLLGQQDAHALGLERQNHVHHLLHNDRCHTFRRLVQQYQKRIAHERAGHGEHLLLAAAHAPAGSLGHFAQVGKQLKQAFGRPVRRG